MNNVNHKEAQERITDAMRSMNMEQKIAVTNLILSIADSNHSAVSFYHANAPAELTSALAVVINAMALPKKPIDNYKQLDADLRDAKAILDLVANANETTMFDSDSVKVATALAYEILNKIGGK
jgi:hypothetical protein